LSSIDLYRAYRVLYGITVLEPTMNVVNRNITWLNRGKPASNFVDISRHTQENKFWTLYIPDYPRLKRLRLIVGSRGNNRDSVT